MKNLDVVYFNKNGKSDKCTIKYVYFETIEKFMIENEITRLYTVFGNLLAAYIDGEVLITNRLAQLLERE